MILPTTPSALAPAGSLWAVLAAAALYGSAGLPWAQLRRFSLAALIGGWLLHGVLLAIDIAGIGLTEPGARLGFAPVLSLTVWLVIGVYGIESRFVPLPTVRQWLALAGLAAVLLCAVFPGEWRTISSRLSPLHFALGVGAYALFGAAVVHGLLLDSAERRLRTAATGGPRVPLGEGLPLMRLERLTFRFVQAGFAVLTAALLLGLATQVRWRWGDHKAIFSILAWAVFAALLVGRQRFGWRGRKATRWLYGGTVLLLLGYVGTRFVLEVLLGRGLG